MIRLKYNSFDTDMGIQMMRNKNKANRRTENSFFCSHCRFDTYIFMPLPIYKILCL